jgi:hypothetical protein
MTLANILGEPGKGFHATRFLGLALWDVVGTILIAWGVSWWSGWSFGWTLLGLFVLAEVLHWLFGVKTAFLKAMPF